MSTQNNDFSYFDAGQDLNEQKLEAVGFRRIQHFNESGTYHRGSVIERGGYGIKDDDGHAPEIGKSETVKHRGGNSTVMRVAQVIEVALVGFSPRYFTVEYDDPVDAGKRVTQIVRNYIPPQDLPGNNARCRSAISLFVALKADPERQLYEVTFKGYNTDDGAKVVNQAKGLANTLAAKLSEQRGKPTRLHTFALWLPIGVGESKMVGKVDQSPVTPPMLAIGPADDLAARLVSREDYARFIELRKELDEFLASGRYTGGGNNASQLMASAPAPALAAPASTQFAANGNYASADGRVNI